MDKIDISNLLKIAYVIDMNTYFENYYNKYIASGVEDFFDFQGISTKHGHFKIDYYRVIIYGYTKRHKKNFQIKGLTPDECSIVESDLSEHLHFIILYPSVILPRNPM